MTTSYNNFVNFPMHGKFGINHLFVGASSILFPWFEGKNITLMLKLATMKVVTISRVYKVIITNVNSTRELCIIVSKTFSGVWCKSW